ncbi:acyl-CoA carboxylase subunit epsilon [Streptomyces sp. 7-21]|nr:acyl-CoA carboxylase subunit epsilon [Streptomyces sp. 7-21]
MEEIRVVRGRPTPEELAAAVAVVRARAAALAREAARAEAGAGRRPSAWHDPARTLPRPLPAPGPGAWRASCWPA